MPSIRVNSRAATFVALLACILALMVFATTAWLATAGRSATVDETRHLVGAWVQTHDDDFRCDPENPALWKYYLLIGIPSRDLRIIHASADWRKMLDSVDAQGDFIAQTLFNTPGNDLDEILRPARLRMLLLATTLGGLIAWWAWRVRGPLAAIVSTIAFGLDPNFLAHSPLAKNDVATAMALFAFMISVGLLCQRATLARCVAMSILLGASLVTKYSCIMEFPALIIAIVCRGISPRPWPMFQRTAFTTTRKLVHGALIVAGASMGAYMVIWACYGFRFEISADPSTHFNQQSVIQWCLRQETLAGHGAPADVSNAQLTDWIGMHSPGVTVRLGKWALEHHALPEAWIVGSLCIYASSLVRDTFLCGHFSALGWWYYFPLAMLFKTPLTTLIGLLLSFMTWLKWHGPAIFSQREKACRVLAAVTAPMLYLGLAMISRYNLGLRHVLPVYPFLFVFLGVSAAEGFQRYRWVAGAVILVFIVGLAIETFSVFPDYIPFFNIVSGGKTGGLKLLSDSNLDWGQDIPLLADWQREHPDRPVNWLLFSGVDPQYYGVRPSEPVNLPHAVFAVSATYLQGTYGDAATRAFMQGLRTRHPIAVLGGSIYLFEADSLPK